MRHARCALSHARPATSGSARSRRPVRHFAHVHPYRTSSAEWKWKIWPKTPQKQAYEYGYASEREAAQVVAKTLGPCLQSCTLWKKATCATAARARTSPGHRAIVFRLGARGRVQRDSNSQRTRSVPFAMPRVVRSVLARQRAPPSGSIGVSVAQDEPRETSCSGHGRRPPMEPCLLYTSPSPRDRG